MRGDNTRQTNAQTNGQTKTHNQMHHKYSRLPSCSSSDQDHDDKVELGLGLGFGNSPVTHRRPLLLRRLLLRRLMLLLLLIATCTAAVGLVYRSRSRSRSRCRSLGAACVPPPPRDGEYPAGFSFCNPKAWPDELNAVSNDKSAAPSSFPTTQSPDELVRIRAVKLDPERPVPNSNLLVDAKVSVLTDIPADADVQVNIVLKLGNEGTTFMTASEPLCRSMYLGIACPVANGTLLNLTRDVYISMLPPFNVTVYAYARLGAQRLFCLRYFLQR